MATGSSISEFTKPKKACSPMSKGFSSTLLPVILLLLKSNCTLVSSACIVSTCQLLHNLFLLKKLAEKSFTGIVQLMSVHYQLKPSTIEV